MDTSVKQGDRVKTCKWSGCDELVDTEPDKDKPSCIYWDRGNEKNSKVVMFTSKKCEHGYCSRHARRLYYQRFGVGKEK